MQPDPNRISDGLGHYWDSATQSWMNDSGGVYQANDYSADPFANYEGTPGVSSQGGNYWDQTNTQQQSGYNYLGNTATSGAYAESSNPNANIWVDGHWWTADGSKLWDDSSQSWLSPQQYNDFKSQQYDYANAQANPQFQPITYQQPGGDWYNYDQYKDSGTGWDTYNLNNPGLSSPDLNYQTPEDAITALRRRGQYVPNDISRADLAARVAALGTPIGDGSFGQGLKDWAGAEAQAVAGATSGEAFQKQLGIDTSYIDWLRSHGGIAGDVAAIGVDTLTAPTTLLGLGAGAVSGGLSGAVRSGVPDILGNLGAQFGASDVAGKIPYFGDQPAWLRGIEGGVIGGITGAGLTKGLGKGAEEGVSARPDLPTPGQVAEATPSTPRFIPQAVNPEDIAFGNADTALSTGMRELPPPSTRTIGGPIESLPNKDLAESFDTASKQLAKLEDQHGHMVLNGDPQAPVVAARVAKLEENWQVLSDEVAKRMNALGVTSVKDLLRDESGQVDLGAVADVTKALAKAAVPIATRTALGAGVGAAYGEASGMGWEKGAAIGAGVGAGFGVLGQVAGKVAARGVEARLAKNTRPEAADKLISLVKQAAPVRESQQELYSQELGKRAGELAKIQARRGGEQGFYEGMGALKGELPKATFNPVRPSMTADEITGLFNHINDLGNMLPFTKMNTQAALVKVLAGELPTRSEITLLGKAFGEDFAKTLLSKRSLGAKAWETAVDALNLPRTLMTSWDASAPLRQGAILFAGHPIAGAKATGAMIRAMASPKYAELVRQGIENSPNATIYEKMGLYFADTTSSAALSAREEAIMSRLAAKIPGVGGSQRGYTTFLNKLRQDVADNFIAGHPNLSNKELKDFGHVINIMSGRGDLPRFLQDNSAILNAAFAPRYAMSRLQLPVEMVKAALPRALGGTTGAASKELARDVTAFVATGTTVLALGKLAGIWNVELDPRSTDFGKGKMGNTRFDFWAGEQQIARYAAQLIGDPTRGVDSLKTGQRKTSTGQIVDANRLDTIGRWLQTKKSPAVGLATDLLSGKDFVGQPIDLKTKEGIGNQAWQRLAPLFLQDMADAAKLSGNQWRALSAGPSAIGAGVQTYQDSDALKRQNWIRDNQGLFTGDLVQPGKTPDRYENLSPSGKQLVDAQYGTLKPFGQESKDAAAVREQAIADQSKDDTKRQMGDMTPEQWRKAYQARNEELVIRKDQIYAGLRASGKLSNNPDPVLDPYYKAIDASAAKNGGNPDWNEIDAYVAGLPESQQQYISKNTGLVKIDTPPVQQFKQDYDAIKASGYFERTDKTWDAIKDSFGVSEPDYYKWKDQQVAQTLSMIGGTPEEPGKLAQAESIVAKMPAVKLMEEGVSNWKQQWAISNSDEAYLAWKYGYYDPTKEIKAYLSAKYER